MRRTSKQPASRSTDYPKQWSEWKWNESFQQDARYREIAQGKWEWEYRDVGQLVDSNSNALEPTPWTPRAISATRGFEYVQGGLVWNAGESTSIEAEQFGQMNLGSEAGGESRYENAYESSTGWGYAGAGQENGGRGTSVLCPMCSMTFNQNSDLERHHKTVHVNDGARPYQCLVEGCTASVKSWTTAAKLRSHEKSWHGYRPDTTRSETIEPLQSSSQLVSNEPRYYPDKSAYPEISAPYSSYIPPQPTGYIAARPTKPKYDDLDARFKVHKSSEFKFGRVFKVLWSEPIGSGGTEITTAKYGEAAFHKIRRFMIIKTRTGHSTCIPILTYASKGVLKPGVHPEDHAIVYSNRKEGPRPLPGEQDLRLKKAIRIEVKDASQKLDPASRLNYAKLYTVEHNVKVMFIGRVAENYEQAVVDAFNEMHPPLDLRSHPRRSVSPAVNTMGSGPYPASIPAATSSTTLSGWQGQSTYPVSNAESYPGSYNTQSYPGTNAYGYSVAPVQEYAPTSETPSATSYYDNDNDGGYTYESSNG